MADLTKTPGRSAGDAVSELLAWRGGHTVRRQKDGSTLVILTGRDDKEIVRAEHPTFDGAVFAALALAQEVPRG